MGMGAVLGTFPGPLGPGPDWDIPPGGLRSGGEPQNWTSGV